MFFFFAPDPILIFLNLIDSDQLLSPLVNREVYQYVEKCPQFNSLWILFYLFISRESIFSNISLSLYWKKWYNTSRNFLIKKSYQPTDSYRPQSVGRGQIWCSCKFANSLKKNISHSTGKEVPCYNILLRGILHSHRVKQRDNHQVIYINTCFCKNLSGYCRSGHWKSGRGV